MTGQEAMTGQAIGLSWNWIDFLTFLHSNFLTLRGGVRCGNPCPILYIIYYNNNIYNHFF